MLRWMYLAKGFSVTALFKVPQPDRQIRQQLLLDTKN